MQSLLIYEPNHTFRIPANKACTILYQPIFNTFSPKIHTLEAIDKKLYIILV